MPSRHQRLHTRISKYGLKFLAGRRQIGKHTYAYYNLRKLKVGVVHRPDNNTTLHAGVNPRSIAFVRAQRNLRRKAAIYVYAKPHDYGGGVRVNPTKHTSAKVGVDSKGPLVEARYRRFKVRLRPKLGKSQDRSNSE